MSLYGAFDKTKHLSELAVPLFGSDGAGDPMTPTERRSAVLQNLFPQDVQLDFGTSDSALSNVDYIDVKFGMDDAGQTGGRAKFHTDITAALGSWSNALKAEVQYGAGGSTSGLGSALVAEAIFGPASDQGNFGVLELEAGAPDGAVNPDLTSFIHCVMYGDTEELAALDDDMALLSIQGGTQTTTDGNMIHLLDSQITNAAVHGTIRIRIGATTYYLPFSDSPTLT